MDTIGRKKVIASALFDLAKGYVNRFGYDDHALEFLNKGLEYFPSNIFLIQLKADFYTARFLSNAQHYESKEKYLENEQNIKEYVDMNKMHEQIDGLGFEEMPDEAYQAWLKSLQREIEKQEKAPRALIISK